MANFRTRRQVTTRKPVVQVDPGLPAGEYRFRLVMVGINNKRSKPHFITVKISQQRGRRIPGISHAGAQVTRSKNAVDKMVSAVTGQKSEAAKGSRKKQASKKSTKKTTKKKEIKKKVSKKKASRKKPARKRKKDTKS